MEPGSQKYMVRDPQGNVYGPADVELLAQWVMQGRIVAGMHIAPPETGEWVEVSIHPALAHLFPKESGPQTAPPSTPGAQQEPAAMPVDQPPSSAPSAAPIPAAPASTYPVTPVDPAAGATSPYASTTPAQNVPALISLASGLVAVVLGGLSPCLCFCIPFAILAGLAAIISGGIALAQIKRDPALSAGRGQAIAGIVLGIAGLFLFIALMVARFAWNFNFH